MVERHLATCICTDCLPGGKQEHRVRPWPVKVGECDHPAEITMDDATHVPAVTRALTRLRVPLMGGNMLEICRLCGSLVGVEEPK